MSFDFEALKDKAIDLVQEAKTTVEYLDVGEVVAKAKRAADKIDKSFFQKIRYEFQDNAKYDSIRSAGRSVRDFVLNYPVYYIQGLAGAIQDKLKK